MAGLSLETLSARMDPEAARAVLVGVQYILIVILLGVSIGVAKLGKTDICSFLLCMATGSLSTPSADTLDQDWP